MLASAFAMRPCALGYPLEDDAKRRFRHVFLLSQRSTSDDVARALDSTRAFARTEIIRLPCNPAEAVKTVLRRDAEVPPRFAFKVFFR